MSTFGEQLKKLRENANMTTAELAEKSGINEYNIVSFEDENRSPEISMLMNLAEALGVKSVDLL